jgi:hypothetical protein
MVLKTSKKIEDLITQVAALQSNYVREFCAQCDDPCCARVHYLFSEKDLLYLRISGRKYRWRRETLKSKGCWFLAPEGCTLDPLSRPFICHRYLCPGLEAEMEKRQPGLTRTLQKKFKLIDSLRSRLWSEYLDQHE